MTITLYSATVPTFQQTLGALAGIIDKGEAFCGEKGLAPAEFIEARLAPDMLPFGYQVKAAVGHSVGAIEGVRKGVYTPDVTPWPDTFAGLKQLVTGGIETLAALTPAEVDAFVGRDTAFVFRDTRLPFAAEDFLLSFSMPNFFFHATTAYDLLRWKGVPLGKKDFVGRARMKKA
jgi:uncharacterized protein